MTKNQYIEIYNELLKEIDDLTESRDKKSHIKDKVVRTLYKVTTGTDLEDKIVHFAKTHVGTVDGRNAELGYIVIGDHMYGFRLNIYGQEECKECGMGNVCDGFYVSTGMFKCYEDVFVAFALPYYAGKPKCEEIMDKRLLMEWGRTQREVSKHDLKQFVEEPRLENGLKAADLVVKAWSRAHSPTIAQNIFWKKVRDGEYSPKEDPEKKPKITN